MRPSMVAAAAPTRAMFSDGREVQPTALVSCCLVAAPAGPETIRATIAITPIKDVLLPAIPGQKRLFVLAPALSDVHRSSLILLIGSLISLLLRCRGPGSIYPTGTACERGR